MQEYKKYQKQNEKYQQTIESLDKLLRKSLQDDLIDESEHKSLCYTFTKYLDGTKNGFFINKNIKLKLKLLVIINRKTT